MGMFDDENKNSTVGAEGMVFNLSDVDEKGSGFACMPKGNYEAICDDVEFGESKKGNPMMTFKFKITEGEFEKRVLFLHATLNQKFGLATLKKTIINLGMDVDWAHFNAQEFADEGDAIGLPIILNVGIQKYEGEKRNNIKDTKPSQEGNGFLD